MSDGNGIELGQKKAMVGSWGLAAVGKGCKIRGRACGEDARVKVRGGDAGEGGCAVVVAVIPFALHGGEEDGEGSHVRWRLHRRR